MTDGYITMTKALAELREESKRLREALAEIRHEALQRDTRHRQGRTEGGRVMVNGRHIAICGIWIGVGLSGIGPGGMFIVGTAVCATIATIALIRAG